MIDDDLIFRGCLISQRQDEAVEVVWCGRAGDYLQVDLRIYTMQFPPRQPRPNELSREGQRSPRARETQRMTREQRIAREA